MITDVIYLIGGTFIWIVVTVLKFIAFTIPDVFETAIAQLFGYFGYAQGILPIVPDAGMSGLAGDIGILTLIGYAIQFITVWYLFKLAIWLFSLVPWIGKHTVLPAGGEHAKSDSPKK